MAVAVVLISLAAIIFNKKLHKNMTICNISPSDRRHQVSVVGNDLVRHYGKKENYSVQEVKNANRRQGINVDVACWSHAVFNTHTDFDQYHETLGETCDYASMKSDMLSSVSSSSNTTDISWFDIDLSWLSFPDIDFSFFDF
jgi:hypothetical protein